MKQSRTIILQRREGILSTLQMKGEVQVRELCAQYGTSEITIRRDLQTLENQGLLIRTHGGAKPKNQHTGLGFDEKNASFEHEKSLIAEYIAPLVKTGSTVFCNAGTTTLAVMARLRNFEGKIITNNAMATSVLAGGKNELICTGGHYHNRTRAFCGNFATFILSKIHADICILGGTGLSASSGVTTSIYQEAQTNELMVERTLGKCIVAIDGSKVGKVSSFSSIPLARINLLVTDSTADPTEISKIKEAGVEVVQV